VAEVEVCRDVEDREGALEDLEKFRKIAVGRELKMVELKEEVKRLKEELENLKVEKDK